ncbi:ComEC/Rec2 family competence protein [Bdellovibrio sp.]|uniref:ComEC/Rec2 family competence protein n=1 Tax=Bdellovibrio sp. TaxID=28201 RepID=UPI0039E234CC
MRLFIFTLITFSASITHHVPARSYVVVWNVGQGQWVTAISASACLHFDMGGEYFPWRKISTQCKDKDNFAFFSHWDWDHIGALAVWKRSPLEKSLCVAVAPHGKSSPKKMHLLKSFASCKLPPHAKELFRWSSLNKKSSNTQSHVLAFQKILLPGDSPISEERKWLHNWWVQKSETLILGHHGSQTSTSAELLKALPHLKIGISSARWGRYHHPHSAVEYRLKQARIPLIRTEDWGNLWLEQSARF